MESINMVRLLLIVCLIGFFVGFATGCNPKTTQQARTREDYYRDQLVRIEASDVVCYTTGGHTLSCIPKKEQCK